MRAAGAGGEKTVRAAIPSGTMSHQCQWYTATVNRVSKEAS